MYLSVHFFVYFSVYFFVYLSVFFFVCVLIDCGINSHKHCKDLVVMECGVRGASVGEDGSHRVTEKQRDSNLSNGTLSLYGCLRLLGCGVYLPADK